MRTAVAALLATAVLSLGIACGVGAWVDHCLASVTWGGLSR